MPLPDRAKAILAIGLLSASAAGAEEERWTEHLARLAELPTHVWLERVRDNPATELAAFQTDGCSGGMSSLWTFAAQQFPAFAEAHEGIPPWESCCVTHDRAYHRAGDDPAPNASYEARLHADRTLRACVAATADSRDAVLTERYGLTDTQVRRLYDAVSAGMFQAVRAGGGPCTGLPWRWGYGYPQCWEPRSE